MRRPGTLLWPVLAVALPAVAQAQTETRFGALASANVGYSNNPFSQVRGTGTGNDGSGSSGYVSVGITPTLQLLRSRSTVTLTGDAQFQKYFNEYPTNENYRASLGYSGRPTERLTTRASVDVTSAIIGSFGAFDTVGIVNPLPVDPADPAIPELGGGVALPPVSDIGLFGTRDRRSSLRANGDASYTFSERDSVNVGGFAEFSRYKRFEDLADYDAYGGTLGYNRQLSQSIRVGVLGSYSSYEYAAPRGKTEAIAVQGTVGARLNERWTADGRLGVTFVESDRIGSTRSNSLSGGLNLCRRGPLSSFCLNASRDVRPTGINGAQYVTSGGVTWSYRRTERDTFTLAAAYSKEGGAQSPLFPIGQNEFFRASAGYVRRVNDRLNLTASANYRDIFGSGQARRADYGGRIGVAYRIGDLR